MKKKFVIVIGNVAQGFRIFGPVGSVAEGHKQGAKIVGEDGEWMVMPVYKTKK